MEYCTLCNSPIIRGDTKIKLCEDCCGYNDLRIPLPEKSRSKKERKVPLVQKLKDRQNNKCAICKQSTILVVDHNHSDSYIRGLLCNKCNLGLGHFEDNVEYLQNAIDYLNNPPNNEKIQY